MSYAMTRAEREAFLADVHIGVLSVAEDGRAPLTVPIWYAYEPGGDLWVLTAPDSRKGRLLAAAGRFSLCAQTETPPYKYVSVAGPIVSTAPCDVERDARPMARRYLGKAMGDQYIAATTEQEGSNVRIHMRPERWLTVDYMKQFGTG